MIFRRGIAVLIGALAVVSGAAPLPAHADTAVTGAVVDEASTPVAGVVVKVLDTDIQTTTDASGAFSLDVPSGTYDFQFMPPHGPALRAYIANDVHVDTTGPLGIVLKPSATIHVVGTLRDSAGNVIANTDVKFHSATGSGVSTARAGANGAYDAYILAGQYDRISLTENRNAPVFNSGSIEPVSGYIAFDSNQRYDITLPTSTLSVSAHKSDGTPVSGAHLKYNTSSTQQVGGLRYEQEVFGSWLATDANGNVSYEIPTDGNLDNAMLELANGMTISTPLGSMTGDRHVDVEVPDAIHLDGTLTDSAGRLITNQELTFREADGDMSVSTRTDLDGHYEIDLRSGQYDRISVAEPQHGDSNHDPLYLNGSIEPVAGVLDFQNSQTFDITIPTSTLTLSVRKNDGAPFAGVRLNYDTTSTTEVGGFRYDLSSSSKSTYIAGDVPVEPSIPISTDANGNVAYILPTGTNLDDATLWLNGAVVDPSLGTVNSDRHVDFDAPELIHIEGQINALLELGRPFLGGELTFHGVDGVKLATASGNDYQLDLLPGQYDRITVDQRVRSLDKVVYSGTIEPISGHFDFEDDQYFGIDIPMALVSHGVFETDGTPIPQAALNYTASSVSEVGGLRFDMTTRSQPTFEGYQGWPQMVPLGASVDNATLTLFDGITVRVPPLGPVNGDRFNINFVFDRPTGTIIWDEGEPVLTGVPDRPANAHGWHNAPVTVNWEAFDPAPSAGAPTVPESMIVETDGAEQVVQSMPSCDRVNRCVSATYTVSIDSQPPSVTFTGPEDGAMYDEGSVPAASCDTIDDLSGVDTPAVVSTVNNGGNSFTTSCSGAIDRAGNTAASVSVSYTVIPSDTTPPVVSGSADRPANAQGWYNAPVAITWSAVEPAPSSGAPTAPAPTNATIEGENVAYTSEPSCDPAGNCASGSYTVSLDRTVPVVGVQGVQGGVTYVEGRVPVASCVTTDTLSGVATSATLQLTNNGGGAFTATCSGAVDEADNSAPPVAVQYTVIPPVYTVTTASKTSMFGNSLSATVGSRGVPVGDTVNVAVAADVTASSVSCSDSRGNTYTVTANIVTGSGRLVVCTAKVVNALNSGNTVSVSYSGLSTTTLVSVNGISSLAAGGVVDKTKTASGTNASPSSGSVVTSTANEVLMGAIAHNGNATATAGAGYTVIGSVSAGSGISKRTLTPEFRLVNTAGTYAATASLTASAAWRAALVTYQ
jgi:hypothetical protein